ncbi:hypothetical protein MUN81_02985 [Hymenobacter sp. 5317J-9]|uniref:hypothetical protein n=1 Tax=Hymenobacter sp. 5317J-9 TaxID=2932250 RepID=UPI001FD6DB93|nr:hypothetical protein [Hymenobacter sp. 5317J-9]UOQ98460.1 hypothetical protein MUN81_02985 [Hymenobacter sp. 5317J-9]
MLSKLLVASVAALVLCPFIGTGQQLSRLDYELYAEIIRSESPPTAKAVVVIRELVAEGESRIVDSAIRERDENVLALLSWGVPLKPAVLDSSSLQAFTSYFGRSGADAQINNQPSFSPSAYVISKRKFNDFFKNDALRGWKRFHKAFPLADEVFEFSRIGYSKHLDKAVVYRAIRRNELNGNGMLLLLEKTSDNRWSVIHRFTLWIN